MRTALLSILLALPAAAAAGDSIYFTSPSGNIFCLGDSRQEYGKDGWWGVTCELRGHRENIRPAQKRPDDCDVDWGNSFSLETDKRPVADCRGDTGRRENAPVLAYGKTIRGKGWQCTSRKDGMQCRNRSGHGFHLSRSRQLLF
ncbi:Uncharacterised protein [Kingella potus]|uniref:Uncharacterized protein n=1 Tax=Kingella potus TaxID=265175 RepID=A0A377R640_9NEIS|nr:DUF6636 domain-containing protein [Kingella potus]UOP00582.1 hypothetical protein LVJ84_12210 [Kingella potus]STR03025.1 Uncharacterised protein [Kingella potus]